MWTMGDDFQYQYAESWFKQMDKLIHYVNKVVQMTKSIYRWIFKIAASELEFTLDAQ